jgi:hypothetical protein
LNLVSVVSGTCTISLAFKIVKRIILQKIMAEPPKAAIIDLKAQVYPSMSMAAELI